MGDLIGYVEGASTYLVIGILIFMFVFVVAALYMFTMNKEQEKNFANMPLSNPKKENHEI